MLLLGNSIKEYSKLPMLSLVKENESGSVVKNHEFFLLSYFTLIYHQSFRNIEPGIIGKSNSFLSDHFYAIRKQYFISNFFNLMTILLSVGLMGLLFIWIPSQVSCLIGVTAIILTMVFTLFIKFVFKMKSYIVQQKHFYEFVAAINRHILYGQNQAFKTNMTAINMLEYELSFYLDKIIKNLDNNNENSLLNNNISFLCVFLIMKIFINAVNGFTNLGMELEEQPLTLENAMNLLFEFHWIDSLVMIFIMFITLSSYYILNSNIPSDAIVQKMLNSSDYIYDLLRCSDTIKNNNLFQYISDKIQEKEIPISSMDQLLLSTTKILNHLVFALCVVVLIYFNKEKINYIFLFIKCGFHPSEKTEQELLQLCWQHYFYSENTVDKDKKCIECLQKLRKREFPDLDSTLSSAALQLQRRKITFYCLYIRRLLQNNTIKAQEMQNKNFMPILHIPIFIFFLVCLLIIIVYLACHFLLSNTSTLDEHYQESVNQEILVSLLRSLKNIISQPVKNKTAANLSINLNGSLSVNNLGLSSGKRKLFEKVNFTIEPGDRVVLIGPSGCGKTSMFSIFNQMNSQYEGTVTFNNNTIPAKRLNPEELRKQFILCTQKSNILNGSIRENIILDANNNSLLFEDIAHEILIDKLIKEKGDKQEIFSMLSGGQMQKIAIARSVYQLLNRAINQQAAYFLLCDEPFSAIDMRSAQQIVAYLLNLQKILSKEDTIDLMQNQYTMAQDLAEKVLNYRELLGPLLNGQLESLEDRFDYEVLRMSFLNQKIMSHLTIFVIDHTNIFLPYANKVIFFQDGQVYCAHPEVLAANNEQFRVIYQAAIASKKHDSI